MMFSRMDGTLAFLLHDIELRSGGHIRRCRIAGRCLLSTSLSELSDLLARRPGATAPPSSARTNQKGLRCVGACRERDRDRQTELEEPVVGAMCDDHFGHLAGHSPTVDATDQSSALAPETLAAESRLLALESNTGAEHLKLT